MRACLLALTMVLAACQERSASPTPSPTPNFTRDAATGETRARIANDAGAATELRSGAAVPVILPAGLTIYPGARILRNTRVERGGDRRALVEFETPDPVASVLLYHRAQALAAGATLTFDLDGDHAASIGGRMRSGDEFALTAQRANGRTAVELWVIEAARPARD